MITLPGLESALMLTDVMSLTKLSKPTLYRKMAAGQFPRPRKVGRASVWILGDVAPYLARR